MFRNSIRIHAWPLSALIHKASPSGSWATAHTGPSGETAIRLRSANTCSTGDFTPAAVGAGDIEDTGATVPAPPAAALSSALRLSHPYPARRIIKHNSHITPARSCFIPSHAPLQSNALRSETPCLLNIRRKERKSGSILHTALKSPHRAEQAPQITSGKTYGISPHTHVPFEWALRHNRWRRCGSHQEPFPSAL